MERNRNVNLRLTEEEHSDLTQKYKKLKYSGLSAFLRYLIFSKEIDIKYSPSEEELAREIAEKSRRIGELNRQIAKIGVNINQVTKKVNSQQYVMREDIDKLFHLLKSVEDCTKKYINDGD